MIQIKLTGPAGFGMQNFVIENDLFGYEISFENQTNATAAVQFAQITNPLSTNLNWQTFQLCEIAFGDVFIPIPPNTQQFQTNLPFSFNGVSFRVEIEAGINLANGQVFAEFFSIDPLTGLPPDGGCGLPASGRRNWPRHGACVIYHSSRASPAVSHKNRQCCLRSI